MSPPRRRPVWVTAESDPGASVRLQAELGVGRVLAEVLAGRGLADPAAARRFLDAGLEELHPPLAMAGMDRAVERLGRAIRAREPVVVYGDYDVDGVTALVMLVDCLRRLGAEVAPYVPDRLKEGYGLNAGALRGLAAAGARLVVTVDAGISALEEAELAAGLGLDLIITDHHTPGSLLPRAAAVLNPRRPDCPYPCKHLAGVGVAFKLVQALLPGGGWEDYLELAALGTVADVVPLLGENRLLVREGLAALAGTRRPGLRALLASAGLAEGAVTAGHVAFVLAPRINAGGRVGGAGTAVRLLITADAGEARQLAEALEQANRERQALETRVLDEAEAMLAGVGGDRRCLVLARAGWHPGVLGIAASRLVDRYHLPTVLLALEGASARGSARSIKPFDICAALQDCAGLLERFGGHPAAAGLALPAERIEEFAGRMDALAHDRLRPADLVPTLALDAEVRADEVDLALLEDLDRLEPCGHGNPTPVLAWRQAPVLDCRAVGSAGNHLRLTLGTAPRALTAMAFRRGDRLQRYRQAAVLDLAFTPRRDRWNGRVEVSLHLRDLAVPGGDWMDRVEAEAEGVLVAGPDGEWAETAAAALAGCSPVVLHARTPVDRRLAVYAGLESGGPVKVVTTFYHGPFLLRRFPGLAGRLRLVLVCEPRPAPEPLRGLARDRLVAAVAGREGLRLAVAACPGQEAFWGGVDLTVRPLPAPSRPAAPGRDALRRAYRALRGGFPAGAVLETGPGQLVRAALAAQVGADLVDATVAVLEELGLVELWPGEGTARLMLNSAPAGTRLDLMESPSFLEGCAGRNGRE